MAATHFHKSVLIMEWLGRTLLGAVFIYAGWGKIADPAAFSQAIANYQLLPLSWINVVALTLPWLEMTCGLALITGVMARGSALLTALMLIIFMIALASGIYRGLDIHCGCFADSSQASTNLYLDLLRDGILLAVCFMVLCRPSHIVRWRGFGKTFADSE